MPGPDDFDRALSRARQVLRDQRSGLAGTAEGADAEPVRGTGEAADGLIRVVAERGRLSNVVLDPRVMRLPSETFAEELSRAVNAALAELESKATAQASPVVDPAALEATLADLQDQSIRMMTRYTQSINEVMARFGSGR